jgi:hypothetical protein
MWCRFWSKFNGNETVRTKYSSVFQGSSHTIHAIQAHCPSQSFNARSPAAHFEFAKSAKTRHYF